MKQVVATNEYSILRKVQMLHSHAQPKDSNFTLGRTIIKQQDLSILVMNLVNFVVVWKSWFIEEPPLKMTSIINHYPKIHPITMKNQGFVILIGSIQHYILIWMNYKLKSGDPQKSNNWQEIHLQKQSVYSVDIIVLKNQSEFEFIYDITMLSCFLRVRELCVLINQTYENQSNRTKLQMPYLSILIGRVKTQKLDGNMRLFELAHILINGQRTLILQESCLQF